MLAHRRLGGVAVMGLQRGKDGFVLAQRALRAPGPQGGLVLEPDPLRFEAGNEPAGGRMAGGGPDGLVECRVQLRITDRIARRDAFAHLDHDLAQGAQALSADAGRGPARQHGFEDRAHLLDLQRLAIRDVSHPRAPVAFEFDQAFLVQPHQGGADCRTARADPLAPLRRPQRCRVPGRRKVQTARRQRPLGHHPRQRHPYAHPARVL